MASNAVPPVLPRFFTDSLEETVDTLRVEAAAAVVDALPCVKDTERKTVAVVVVVVAADGGGGAGAGQPIAAAAADDDEGGGAAEVQRKAPGTVCRSSAVAAAAGRVAVEVGVAAAGVRMADDNKSLLAVQQSMKKKRVAVRATRWH